MVKARGMGLDSLQNLTEMTVTSFPLTSPLALDEAGSPAFHKTAATLISASSDSSSLWATPVLKQAHRTLNRYMDNQNVHFPGSAEG